MIKNIGIEMTDEIYNLLKSTKVMAFITTYSDKGVPFLTPINLFYPKNKESILIAMISDSLGYQNMVWQKKICVSIIDPSMTIHMICRAGVLRAPSYTHPNINIVLADIIDIIEEDTLLVNIKEGVKWGQISLEMKGLYDMLMCELQDCITSI